MATKQISQLPSTNISNDTDLLMTRQGAEDKQVPVEKVRNIGTEAGQSLGVGGYGIGGNAIEITNLFSTNNADLITRTGVYLVNGTANVPVADGELIHTQSSATSATQRVLGTNEEKYFRKKVAGVWKDWRLDNAVDKDLVRTDLGVYSKTEADARYLNEDSNLSDLPDKATARFHLDVYSKTETDARYLNESSNLGDLENVGDARFNLSVFSQTESDNRYLKSAGNLADLGNKTTARTNLDVYSKGDVYTRTESDARYLNEDSNLSDLTNIATARTNLSVYSKTESDARYLNEDSNLSDLPNKTTARSNLDVYSKADVYTKIESENRYLNEDSNLSDLSNKATARNNLDVYSKFEVFPPPLNDKWLKYKHRYQLKSNERTDRFVSVTSAAGVWKSVGAVGSSADLTWSAMESYFPYTTLGVTIYVEGQTTASGAVHTTVTLQDASDTFGEDVFWQLSPGSGHYIRGSRRLFIELGSSGTFSLFLSRGGMNITNAYILLDEVYAGESL